MNKALVMLSAMVLAGGLAMPAMAQGITPNEVNNFNTYLSNHPNTAAELKANPGLADNPNYMANHPGLQTFLANHPGVREELHQNPGRMMGTEERNQWPGGGNQWHGGGPGGPVAGGPGGYSGPPGGYGGGGSVARFDNGYMAEHPGVGYQLAQNPKLVDDPQFRATHPGLVQYLNTNPGVRQELEQHPERFMAAEQAYRHGVANGSRPFATADNYLDHHPEVSQQLNKDPRLIDDPQYIASHPGLHDYLENHSVAREAWKNHPDKFMNHEDQYHQKHG
ncbi:MAG: hypothetical protein ACLQDV_12620 [Candidatus Binataceae bacterium]